MVTFARYALGMGLAGWCLFIYGWSLLLMIVPSVFTNNPEQLRLIKQGTVEFLTTSDGFMDLLGLLAWPTVAGVCGYFLLRPLLSKAD